MSILDNVGKNLDKDFENHNYLPQGIFLEDIDLAIVDYIKNLNLTVEDETGNQKTVPVIFLAQELWAERKMNWKDFRFEYGEELSRPFIAIARKTVKPGTSPLKRTIPVKKQFKFVKVPTFDGTLKGYYLYKIPQPTWVDVEYDMILAAYYMVDVNAYYEKVLRDIEIYGNNFCMSGFRDERLKIYIEDNGGIMMDSVTKKLNFLIVKDKSKGSSKIEKAENLGITIIDLNNI